MNRAILIGMIMITLAAGGCRSEASSEAQPPATRPPQPACDQAAARLAQARGDGDFLFEDSGDAMVDQDTWMRMPEGTRERLMQSLAVVAACHTEVPQREVAVTIRNDQGVIIITRYIEPSTDFRVE